METFFVTKVSVSFFSTVHPKTNLVLRLPHVRFYVFYPGIPDFGYDCCFYMTFTGINSFQQ